jgi:hypothetical protein
MAFKSKNHSKTQFHRNGTSGEAQLVFPGKTKLEIMLLRKK